MRICLIQKRRYILKPLHFIDYKKNKAIDGSDALLLWLVGPCRNPCKDCCPSPSPGPARQFDVVGCEYELWSILNIDLSHNFNGKYRILPESFLPGGYFLILLGSGKIKINNKK